MTMSFLNDCQAVVPVAKRLLCLMTLGLTLAVASPNQSAVLPQESAAEKPIEVTLHPAAEPVPALRYRLLPERREQIQGNAAVFYHRAVQTLILDRGYRMAENLRDPAKKKPTPDEQISEWAYKPISEIPHEKARELLASRFSLILNEVEQGARRASCDWEFDHRTDGIWLLLPEMQEIRALARLVAVKARLAILDGKPDEAMRWIKIGLGMGRHVAHGPILIQALVGIAIDSLMNQCLLELIQTPGTPSLVWALADRPSPFIDPRYSLEGERYLLEKELPELKNLETHVWSADEARQFADGLQRKLFTFSSELSPIAPGTPDDTASFGRRLQIASMASRIYLEASQSLIAHGWPEENVKAMPIIQVACLHTYLEYKKLRDQNYKWINVPYHQSFDKLERANKAMMSDNMKNPMLPLLGQLTPALSSARMSFVRLDRQFDALQVIEAIRLYTHNHQGKLPPSLEAITEAPVPYDPATSKPFGYKVADDTATLSAPILPGGPDHPNYKINYLLKLAR